MELHTFQAVQRYIFDSKQSKSAENRTPGRMQIFNKQGVAQERHQIITSLTARWDCFVREDSDCFAVE